MSLGYLEVYGAPHIGTNFNPQATYTGNSNYLKIDFRLKAIKLWFLWNGSTESAPWFSFENGPYSGCYPNIGNSTAIFKIDTSYLDGEHNLSLILDNGVISLWSEGVKKYEGSFTGDMATSLYFYYRLNGTSSEHSSDFYSFKVSDRDGNVQYDYVAASYNGEAKLYDKVSGQYFGPTEDTGSISFIKTSVFEPSKSSFKFNMTGGSEDFTLSAQTGWTATTESDWVSVSPSTGTTGGTISLTCTENTTTSARTATITFTDEDEDTFDITVNQKRGDESRVIRRMYRSGEIIYQRIMPKTEE